MEARQPRGSRRPVKAPGGQPHVIDPSGQVPRTFRRGVPKRLSLTYPTSPGRGRYPRRPYTSMLTLSSDQNIRCERVPAGRRDEVVERRSTEVWNTSG